MIEIPGEAHMGWKRKWQRRRVRVSEAEIVKAAIGLLQRSVIEDEKKLEKLRADLRRVECQRSLEKRGFILPPLEGCPESK